MWQTLQVAFPLASPTLCSPPTRNPLGRAFALALLLSGVGCIVPSLGDLEEESIRACNAEHPCAPGYDCVDRECREPGTSPGGCSAQQPCTTGFVCVEGACQPDPNGPGCNAQKPCQTGFECVSGECRELPVDGGCTPGSKVSCDVAVPQCFAGERTCGEDGGFGPCVEVPLPHYEPVEQSCDGLDNDCDGRVDVIDRFSAVTQGSAPRERSLASMDGGFIALAATGPTTIRVQSFNPEFEPDQESVFTLDGVFVTGHLSTVSAGDNAFFSFADRVQDGTHQITFGRANLKTNLTWLDETGDRVARGLNFSNTDPIEDTRIAITARAPNAVMPLWRFGGYDLTGVVYTAADGTPITPDAQRVPILDVQPPEEIIDIAALGRDDTFVVAWALRNGTSHTVHVAELNKQLGFVGPSIRTINATGAVKSLTLVRNPTHTEGSLYWLEESTSGQFAVVTVQKPLTQPTSTVLVGPTAEPMSSLQAAHTEQGPLLAWRQGGVNAKVVVRTPKGVTTPVTPTGVTPLTGPYLAWDPVRKRYWVAYDVAQAGGVYFYRTLGCGL